MVRARSTSRWRCASRLASCAAAVLVSATAHAASVTGGPPVSGDARPADRPLVRVRVIPDVERVEPGRPFHLAVLFDIAPGWHLYWKNPGAGAARIEVSVEADAATQVLEARWPRPRVLESPTGDMYVYEGEAGLFVPIVAPAGAAGELELTVDVAWAVCDEKQCHLGDARRTVRVPVGKAGAAVDDPALRAAWSRLSRPLENVEGASVTYTSGELRVEVPAPGYTMATFVPNGAPGVVYGTPTIDFAGERLRLLVPVEIDRNNVLGGAPKVGGLVALGPASTDPSFEFETPVRSFARLGR